jgi:DMSO/TMAO reductase YedYZ heme-binding membrane subunit
MARIISVHRGLLMALAVTPAATIFRWPALVDVRRIGVTALVYTIAHVVIYFAFRHLKRLRAARWWPALMAATS